MTPGDGRPIRRTEGHGELLRPVGVVLAGGRSRRMGSDKARLEWVDGRSMLDWTIERLWRVTGETVLVAGGDREPGGLIAPTRAARDADARGPLAGLLGAAAESPGRSLLVLACDLPLVTESSLRALVDAAGSTAADATVAWGPDRWQPLCAVYAPASLEVLAERARRGEHALYRALRSGALSCERFLGPEDSATNEWHRQLFNVNTPEDLEQARQSARQEIETSDSEAR